MNTFRFNKKYIQLKHVCCVIVLIFGALMIYSKIIDLNLVFDDENRIWSQPVSSNLPKKYDTRQDNVDRSPVNYFDFAPHTAIDKVDYLQKELCVNTSLSVRQE